MGPCGPTPVRAAIVNLLADLRDAFGLSYLFISHDLAVVAQLADRIAVMDRGGLCETGSTPDVLQRPYHPYTQALLAAVPQIGAAGLTYPAAIHHGDAVGQLYHDREIVRDEQIGEAEGVA